MEELFEILIVIALAVFGIKKSSKNKKKAADKPQSAQPTRPVQPVEPARPAPKRLTKQNLENAFAAFTELLEDDDLPNPDKPAPVKMREQTAIEAETALKQHMEKIKTMGAPEAGESATDAHGCVGGSMPNHTAEGESLAEHAEHERKRRERLKAESKPIRAENLRKPSLTELRKAVVMSEILDKPVSLRRRRI